MNQHTFWDGEDAREKAESSKIAKVAAKIRLTNLLEKEAAEVQKRARPKKDFRIGAPKQEEVAEEVVEERKELVEITAEHVAAQLLKLWKMGVVTGADDPEAAFYAQVLKEFGGTVQG